MMDINPRLRPVQTVLAWALLAWALCTLINGLLPHLQMLVLGGRVVVPPAVMRVLLLLIIGLAVLTQGLHHVPRGVLYWWIGFMGYLLFELLLLRATYDRGLGYLITGFYIYFVTLLVIPLAPALRGLLRGSQFVWVFCLAFIPLGLLGLAQYLLSDPIVRTQSVDGYFWVHAWRYWATNDVRAFSLFNSGVWFGHYGVLVAVLLVTIYVRANVLHRIYVIIPALVFTAAVIYATLSRTSYIEAACAVVAAWLLARQHQTARTPWLVFLPVLFWLASYLVSAGGPELVNKLGFGQEGLLAKDSLLYRRSAWTTFTDEWLNRGMFEFLFGTGIKQGQPEGIGSEGSVLIDNIFIAVGLQVGAVGLAIYVGLMWAMWRYALAIAWERRTIFSCGLAAFWSTWPVAGMFSSAVDFHLVIYLLLMCESLVSQPVRKPPADIRRGLSGGISGPATPTGLDSLAKGA